MARGILESMKARRNFSPQFLMGFLALLVSCFGSSVAAGPARDRDLGSAWAQRQSFYRKSAIDSSMIRLDVRVDRRIERVQVPRNIPLVEFALELWNELQPMGFSNLDVVEKGRGAVKQIEFRFREGRHEWLIILGYGDPLQRFAFVLFLEGLESAEPRLVEEFARISPSFGYVVAPADLGKACSMLRGRGEVLARLPLEPVRSVPGGPRTILLQSSEHEIRGSLHFLREPACAVSGVVPPENSIVLRDERVMSIVLEEIRKRKTYFLETGSLRHSAARQAAASASVPYLGCRDVIAADDPEKAETQIRRLIMAAEKTGKAMAKTRISEKTLGIIRKLSSELENGRMEFRLPSSLLSSR